MNKLLFLTLCLASALIVSCTKSKDRLVSDTLTVAVTPSILYVSTSATVSVSAICRSAQSNSANVSPSWTVSPVTLGTFSPTSGKTTTFTAGTNTGSGKIYATYAGIQGSGVVSVIPSTATSSGGGGGGGGNGTITLYSDAGLYTDGTHTPNIDAWGSGGGSALTEISGGGSPGDTLKYESDPSGAQTWAGWGIIFDKNTNTYGKDMSAYASGHIKFYLKTSRALTGSEQVEINVEGPQPAGAKSPNIPIGTAYSWDNSNTSWQEVSVPLSDVTGVPLTGILLPFEITVINLSGSTPITMDVDDVRWTTN